eukprot:SAG11_NODE_10656_length_814_cov_0.595804_1_plen_141_part_10
MCLQTDVKILQDAPVMLGAQWEERTAALPREMHGKREAKRSEEARSGGSEPATELLFACLPPPLLRYRKSERGSGRRDYLCLSRRCHVFPCRSCTNKAGCRCDCDAETALHLAAMWGRSAAGGEMGILNVLLDDEEVRSTL